jgi:hypothetical protein
LLNCYSYENNIVFISILRNKSVLLLNNELRFTKT